MSDWKHYNGSCVHPLDSIDSQEAFVRLCLHDLEEMGIYRRREHFEGPVKVDALFDALVFDPVVTTVAVDTGPSSRRRRLR
jgi:hypothetical protein